MTNVRLYLVIGIPMLFNAVLLGVVIAFLNVKFDGLHRQFDDRNDRWAEFGTSRKL